MRVADLMGPPGLSRNCSSLPLRCSQQGFSLVEGLVAMVVLVVAVAGTATAFNLIVSSISRSSGQNAASLAIDNDVAQIKRLAAIYTACANPAGALPVGTDPCGNGATQTEPEYFFPADPADINAFFTACAAASGSHIVDGFVNVLTATGTGASLPSSVGAGVTRTSIARQNSGDPKNHNVIIRYSTGRIVKVAPVVSAWCP